MGRMAEIYTQVTETGNGYINEEVFACPKCLQIKKLTERTNRDGSWMCGECDQDE